MVGVVMAMGAAAHGEAKKYPWEKDPGPIAGRWKVTCSESAGMIVDVSVKKEKLASGRVSEVGAAKKYGYSEGEEILRLEADDFGDWVGQLKWRSVSGVERWDPIRMVATPDKLNATMTTDACYKNMPRVAK